MPDPVVFVKVDVYPQFGNRTLITWELHPNFNLPGPYTFVVQFSRSGSVLDSEWTDIATITNSYQLLTTTTDVVQRSWSAGENWFYRVKLTLSDYTTYISYAEPAWGSLPRVERLKAKDIFRREMLRYTKTSAGSMGFLVKRKHWGTPCTACLDPNTSEATDIRCPVCFNTAIVGGYFLPIPYWLDFYPGTATNLEESDTGYVETVTRKSRALAYPLPRPDDVWINAQNNKRFYILKADVLGEMRSVPLSLDLILGEAPPTDIIYDVNTGLDEPAPDPPPPTVGGPWTMGHWLPYHWFLQ